MNDTNYLYVLYKDIHLNLTSDEESFSCTVTPTLSTNATGYIESTQE